MASFFQPAAALHGGGNGIVLELIPLWGSLCSLAANNLDAATMTAIKAAWGDRGGNLSL